MTNRLPMFLLIVFLLGPSLAPAAPVVDKAEFQAAFCLHVALFVRWPNPSEKPLRIGVWKSPDTFRALTRYVATRTLQGRPVVALDLREAAGARECDLIFFEKDCAAVLNVLGDKPVMTIGLEPRFLEQGGILQMVPIENRMGFMVNQESAKRHHIRLGSQLMNLALRTRFKNTQPFPKSPGERP